MQLIQLNSKNVARLHTHKVKLKGYMKESNISIDFFFSAHQSVVFYFRCSVYWWKGSVRF